MIRKLVERYTHVMCYNANDFVALAECDQCNDQFLFAGVNNTISAGVQFIAGEYYQFSLIKFCPFCGARNTAKSTREQH